MATGLILCFHSFHVLASDNQTLIHLRLGRAEIDSLTLN